MNEHIWSDGEHQYPVFEGIPYLRTGREELISCVLRQLEAGKPRQALCLLLQDQDDWAKTSQPSCESLEAVIENRLCLRDAMQALQFGPVGDYFAYRWSDPTFLSGLALLETHLPSDARVLELACGIGHYLREFEMRSIPVIGADVVFAKLWLARRYMTNSIPLVCFDASSPFPFSDGLVNTVFCHDAFYFLPKKQHVVSEMRRVSGPDGTILIGHTHCSEADNFSAGEPLTTKQYAALLPNSVLYDDAALTASAIDDAMPLSHPTRSTAAIALATNQQQNVFRFKVPVEEGSRLQLNPLLTIDYRQPQWPSRRYQEEYAALSDYLSLSETPCSPTADLIRRRVYLSLPSRW